MRVAILSKALIVGAYQTKLEAIAQAGVELTALVPPSWHEPRVGPTKLERRYTKGYQLEVLPIALNGRHHLHFYPTLGRALRRLRPEVLHIDEESFNFATFLAMRAGLAVGAKCCFYNWANIERRYPPPFSFFERYNLRHAAHAIAGNREAAAIIRRHGYRGPLSIIPQFGVEPSLFTPRDPLPQSPFTVGYVGRLLKEKGVLDLLEAVAGLPEVRLELVGDGVLREVVQAWIAQPDLADRVRHRAAVTSTEVPTVLRELDVLVLPSRTMPNWKEQFGRVLIEAMSSGVNVVGSNSGEIPNVIGEAGLIFPEGDVVALRTTLKRLLSEPELRSELRERGLARVQAEFTQAAIARRYVEVYRSMLTAP